MLQGIWQPPQPSLKFSHLNTVDYMHTNLSSKQFLLQRLQYAVSYPLAHKRQRLPPSLPLLFLNPPYLHQLHTPTLLVSTPLYLLPCLLPHAVLQLYLYTPSLLCLYSPHCSSLFLRLHLPSPLHHPIQHRYCIISPHPPSLLCSFIVFFSPLSCLGIL